MNKVMTAIDGSGSFRVYLTDSTQLVRKAAQIHHTTPLATAGLGRVLTAAGLMGLMLKGEKDKLTLIFKGSGPARQILATADGSGNVKGYIANPDADLPLKENGKLDVSGAVGTDGLLYVMRDTGGAEPYVGCTPIVSGEIAEDITSYYAVSEQTPTVCALGVLVNPDLTVRAAGGFLVQLLPFCPEEVISQVERNVAAMDSMTAMLDGGMTVEEICGRLLRGFEYDVVDTYTPEYRCTCSRQRVERAFSAMGPQELRELPDAQGRVEVTCRFCDKIYRFTADEMERMAAEKD